ncbi:MAG: hypothetical protein SPI03_05565 [Campylobacter sputorum]|uniref:hypothetical protein n=1 Tax=Campylobacter sputorum TaxID=206 RepID=UPI000B780339|nr:hypothetical protein [Campylobacter sputorum]MDY6120785.1 hypothetical protein [Campylobacter sputorum]
MLEVSNSKNIKTGLNSTIHFENFAAVLRAVEKGYIKVDGKDIKLSDEDKKNLLKMDKIAEEKKLAEFYKRGVAVCRQQSAAWDLYFKELLGIDINDKSLNEIRKVASKGVDVMILSGKVMKLV